jgi:hypothetical protein
MKMRLFQVPCIIVCFANVLAAQHVEVPITATISDTYVKTLADGNTLSHSVTGSFYRDQNGRIRIERDGQISIQNPVDGFSAVLDTGARTARRLVTPQRTPPVSAVAGTSSVSPPPAGGTIGTSSVVPPAGASGGAAPGSTPLPPAPIDLGKKVVSGFLSSGKQFTTTVPVGAIGNILPIVTTTEVWISNELHLPLMLKTSSSLNGDHTTVYDDINVITTQLDPGLFVIPADYQVTTTTNVNPNSPLQRGLQLLPGK